MSIELKNINKKYGQTEVLSDFNFNFSDGEITCLLGRSGSGKTTILNVISGLIEFEGKISGIDGDISYIFQKERLIPIMTVYKNLEYILLNKIKDKVERHNRIMNILSLVEMTDKKDNYPSELSGGMSQRVSMARAFLFPSKILLMDEPFRALDLALKRTLIDAFLKLWKNDKKTIIFVTHDIDEALMLSNRIAVIAPLKDNVNEIKDLNLTKSGNIKSSQIILDEQISSDQNTRTLSDPSLIALRVKLYNTIVNY